MKIETMQKVCDAYTNGKKTAKEIANFYDIGESTVYYILKTMNVPVRNKELSDAAKKRCIYAKSKRERTVETYTEMNSTEKAVDYITKYAKILGISATTLAKILFMYENECVKAKQDSILAQLEVDEVNRV